MRALALIGVVALSLGGCAPKLPEGVDSAALNQAVGRAIGGPSTCVEIADRTGKLVWRAGGYITCSRDLTDCAGRSVTAGTLLDEAIGKPARFVSCPTGTGGVNTVGWALGPVPVSPGKPDRGLTYVAVMEGERALPGREVQARVERAFARAGL